VERRNRVKKNEKRDQWQEKKSRRLKLSRETIQTLHDPALFGVAGGAPITRDGAAGSNECGCPRI
jgi:hypothetical protein